MESEYFTCIPTRNCRRFYKHNYELKYRINKSLVSRLEKFGILNTIQFSKFSNQANDLFKIKMDDEIELSGVLNDHVFRLTISKQLPELVQEVESILEDWSIAISSTNQTLRSY